MNMSTLAVSNNVTYKVWYSRVLTQQFLNMKSEIIITTVYHSVKF